MAEMILCGVTFKTIPGYSSYMVGTDGSVISFRSGGVARLLQPSPNKATGYKNVRAVSDTGAAHLLSCHRAVLMAFRGMPPDGHQACHNNGVRTDNRLDNLRWDTVRGNHSDKQSHGTEQKGSAHGMAILNEASALEIKKRIVAGHALLDIANDYGVSAAAIHKIKRGKNWLHVAPEMNARFPGNGKGSRRFSGIRLTETAAAIGISKTTLERHLSNGASLEQIKAKFTKPVATNAGEPEWSAEP